MKVLDIIDSLPVGGVVPKRVLAVLKRAGKIESYSCFGYLDGRAGFVDVEYKGRYFESKYFDGCFCPYLVKADIRPKRRMDMIQYKGSYKRKYGERDMLASTLWNLSHKVPNLTNAFWDYYWRKQKALELQPTRTFVGKVNHKICLWGAVI